MPKLRVHNLAVSVDGYAAGPDQSIDNPLGVGGTRLHEWVFATRTGCQMMGTEGGEGGVDDDFWARGDVGIGATIMGRNMYGPVRGAWDGDDWTGWWGDEPPYHHPVFVLSHHPRPPVPMEGGTTFHFVNEGIEAALQQAFEAAEGADVRIGGGASTVQQYLRAGLIDDLHVAIVPILLGGGERLFDHLDGGPDGYECVEFTCSASVAHVRFAPTSTT
ncbi:MAG: dihydrofolate reductase family protein [Acidimicrobiales bacterium]